MNRLETYLRRHAGVPGWLDPYSARFIAALSKVQHAHGISGSVAEIGVHMGRLFILLKLLTDASERALAIDVFGDQHLNTDQSGFGDRDRFLANLVRHASGDGVNLLQRSSLEVTPEDILGQVGPCRLFSIDGGHTAACTRNDLLLADRALSDKGVAILDDYFNQSWPDVSTGAAQFFADESTTLRPFAITPNKLYLARPAQHAFYRAELKRSQQGFSEKESEMFGHGVSIFGVEPETHALARSAKRWVRASIIGPPLVEVRQRLRSVAR